MINMENNHLLGKEVQPNCDPLLHMFKIVDKFQVIICKPPVTVYNKIRHSYLLGLKIILLIKYHGYA